MLQSIPKLGLVHAKTQPACLGKKKLLHLLTCGSVDDGKSTLIGRLFYDCKLLFEDQLAALADSALFGATGNDLDMALLVDGLQAEHEQSITIDVAYRYFATPRRGFIVVDAPGQEQYTRNLATSALTADLAVLLIDAQKGPLTQNSTPHSCRHAARHPRYRRSREQDGCGRLGPCRVRTHQE